MALSVEIGSGASAGTAQDAVAIGTGAIVGDLMHGSVVVGKNAKALANQNGAQQVAFGEGAEARQWRASAFGAFSLAAAVSSSAIGFYAWCLATHGLAVGRGAIVPANKPNALVFGDGSNIYFANGWAARYKISVPTWNEVGVWDHIDSEQIRNPTSNPVVLHGMSGYDQTDQQTDTPGGNIILAGGQGTGTAEGGSVKLQTAPAGGASNNTENALVDRVIVDSAGDMEIVTDGKGLILSSANGTRYRVTVDNDGQLTSTPL